MRTVFAFVLGMMVMLLAGAGAVDEPGDGVEAKRMVFDDMGFSMAPLSVSKDSHSFTPVMMFLPPERGFSSNVNVRVQPFKGSLKDYTELSKREFKQVGFNLLDSKLDGPSWQAEYTGKIQGREHHWYARVWQRGDRVYLVTATSTPVLWKKHAEQLKACVDSFALDAVEDQGEIDGGG